MTPFVRGGNRGATLMRCYFFAVRAGTCRPSPPRPSFHYWRYPGSGPGSRRECALSGSFHPAALRVLSRVAPCTGVFFFFSSPLPALPPHVISALTGGAAAPLRLLRFWSTEAPRRFRSLRYPFSGSSPLIDDQGFSSDPASSVFDSVPLAHCPAITPRIFFHVRIPWGRLWSFRFRGFTTLGGCVLSSCSC